MRKSIFLFGTIFILLCLSTTVAYSQITYTDDTGRFAELSDLSGIMQANNNLIVVGPEDVSRLFDVRIDGAKSRLPFRIRTLINCGKCVLFYTVDRVFYGGIETSINQLVRRPEVKRKLSNRVKRAQWWKRMKHDSRFADERLGNGWHLVRLTPKGLGTRFNYQTVNRDERIASPNLYFWMFLVLPRNSVPLNLFYTSARVFKIRNVVTIGMDRSGLIDIYYQFNNLNITGIGILPEIKPDSIGRKFKKQSRDFERPISKPKGPR